MQLKEVSHTLPQLVDTCPRFCLLRMIVVFIYHPRRHQPGVSLDTLKQLRLLPYDVKEAFPHGYKYPRDHNPGDS